jgi:hypothetical protein
MQKIHQIKLEIGQDLYHKATPYITKRLQHEKNIFNR